MMPAQQRLEAPGLAGDHVDLRLVDHGKVFAVDGRAHALFQHQTGACTAIHVLIEEAVLLTPRPLGFVHRNVRRAQQAIQIGAAVRVDRDADTRP